MNNIQPRVFYVYEYWDISEYPPVPLYVGKGCGKRAWSHIKRSTNRRLQYKINLLISKGFPPDIKIIQQNLLHEEACILERERIVEYGRRNMKTGTLYNLTDGGEGSYGRICSEETKNIFSKQRKGKSRTESQKEAFKNRAPLTEEQLNKKRIHLAEIRKKSHTDDSNKKRAQSLKGHKPSDHTREIWSKQRKGRGPCNLALARAAEYQSKFVLYNVTWNNWFVYIKDTMSVLTGTRYFCMCVECGHIKSIIRDSIIKQRNVVCPVCEMFEVRYE